MDAPAYIKIMKRGFNYSQDGPGNRLIYHLQGCNMKCPWCSNPEGMALGGCALKDGSPSYVSMALKTIVDEAESARPLFFDDGGVTLTGGEPTLQFDEVRQLLKMLKQRGVNTAIETNATGLHLPELFEYVDTLIMDFKHYDDVIHTRITGVSNETVINNIKNAASVMQKTLIRTPLIKGFNAEKSDAEGFLAVYSGIDVKNMSFEVLAYHEYGKKKWADIGLEYNMSEGFIDEGVIEFFENAYRANGLKVVRT